MRRETENLNKREHSEEERGQELGLSDIAQPEKRTEF